MLQTSENRWLFRVTLLFVFFVSPVLVAQAQGQSPYPSAAASPTPGMPQQAPQPLYTNYRSVQIGMSADEAREKLGKPKSKGKTQDFFVFSEQESAEVFYLDGKVSAVSVDYVGANSGAPTPMDVFGAEVKPMKSGRVYKIVRYPKAGYWVSYNRTASKTPIVSITMKRIRPLKG